MNSEKLIINAALTGTIPTKEMNPYVPLTPAEIAKDAKRVYELGASIIHLHARKADGTPTYEKNIFKDIIKRIRDQCNDVILTVSTSGRKTKDIKQRLEVLELNGYEKPDMGSMTLGSMNFIEGYNLNPPDTIRKFLELMKQAGIKPELEIFDSGMANYASYLYRKGYLKGIQYTNLLLGSLGSIPATPRHLINLVDELHENMLWAATGVGRFAFHMQNLAIAMGGNVRVGIEDTIHMDAEKHELATNEKLVMRVKRVAETMGREIATPGEVRTLLNL